MNTPWHDFLISQAARFQSESGELADFGDAAAELQAAKSGTVLVPLTHFGLIECAGDDAKSFLHNQLTSDINHLAPDQAQHSAWCTAKGRMLASFVIWRNGDAYRLSLATELVAAIQKRLQMYVLRAKVVLTDASNTTVLIGIAGPQAVSALASAGLTAPSEALKSTEADAVRVICLDNNRYLVAVAAEQAPALWTKLAAHARPAGLPVWHWLDIEAALPVITAATREEFVPQMADFEKIGGVSFHKGCYPGQEIVARTQYLGKVKRHLFRVKSDAPLAAGDDLQSPENPDQSIGKIVTSAQAPEGGYVALAVIQSNFAATARLRALDGPSILATAVNPVD